MTEFRKELNKLFKEKAIAEIIDSHEDGRSTFKEAIRAIAERMELEDDVFWAVKDDKFVMCTMTDEELVKKIKSTKTEELREFMKWKDGDKA